MFHTRTLRYTALALLLGCAGWQRECSSGCAERYGADWVVVQMDLSGRPFRCWELHNASISNEEHSDGIYWVDPESGNLVHISNLYNRVQVVGRKWDEAYRQLGLTREVCRATMRVTRPDGG